MTSNFAPVRVDVVIPTFNRRDLVVGAVRSVLGQTHSDLRCIVVDDGSTDGTCRALSDLGDQRLVVRSTGGNLGASNARNLGISCAKGAPWVAFLDSDDLWAPDKHERELAALAAVPGARWAATACANVSGELEVRAAVRLFGNSSPSEQMTGAQPGELLDLLRDENWIPAGCSTVMVSSDLLSEVGGFAEELATNEDWDLWIRLAKRSCLAYVDAPLVACRIWEGQTSNNWKAFVKSAADVRSRHFPGTNPEPREYLARWHQECARRSVASGHRLSAAIAYLSAAWSGRAPGQLLYAAAAATSPGLAERRLRRIESGRTIPPGWSAEVEAWLGPLRPS